MLKSKIFVPLLFLIITVFFFSKVFVEQLPIPGDFLVGTYFPWVDYKWGYEVGVPVKNPSLTDVIASLYPWRDLSMNLIKQGQLPLWNPYSFSGTPLLANLQSAPLYPLNIFMLFLPIPIGWTIMLMLQIFLSLSFMFLYLRNLKLSAPASFLGSIVFAFSGFMTTYLEYATIGQVFLWLPLLLFLSDKYIQTKKSIYTLLSPLVGFCVITAGNFQAAFYLYLVLGLYLIFKRRFIYFLIVSFLTAIVGAIQIIPTLELFLNSIRNFDQNISQYNFGLLPLKNLLTIFVPDFFGHPATYNFWGTLGYQESSVYFGIISSILLISSFYLIRSRKIILFYTAIFIISLISVFDLPFNKLIYLLNIPILSSSYATRAFLITNFAAAVLVAFGFHFLQNSRKLVFKISISIVTVLILIEIIFFAFLKTPNTAIALRNTILPVVLMIFFILILKFLKKEKFLMPLIIILVTLDLLRFGLKFNTFSEAELLFPKTPVIEYLDQNIGNYRFDRESSEVIPPNTWISYKLMSPSGYDPLSSLQYAKFYNVYNNNSPENGVSRYSELSNYNSPFIDLLGVKFLVVAKRNKDGSIDKTSSTISSSLNNPKYIQIFEDKSVVILENTNVLERVILFDQFEVEENSQKALEKLYSGFDFKNKVIISQNIDTSLLKNAEDFIDITNYSANKVEIDTQTFADTLLLLTDSFYPGWVAQIDGKDSKILLADGVFRAILLPGGKHQVSFIYNPLSFKIGFLISGSSIVLIFLLILITNQSQKK